MSIIESAFLKTLKNSKQEIDEKSNKKTAPVRKDVDTSISNAFSKIEIKHAPGHYISSMSQTNILSHSELSKLGIIYAKSSDTKLVNEYRNLRTNLIASQSKKNFTTLVTCIVPNYDITYIVANIATAFSLDSNKTSLIINADISEDSLSQLLDIETDLGVIDYLESEKLEVENILYETPISRLRYIPHGKIREDTSEYFTSTKMKNFVDTLLSRYSERFPIIQAPSIGASADTPILVDSCDCVILVCPYGVCDENSINEAMLTVGSEKFAGIVLADFD